MTDTRDTIKESIKMLEKTKPRELQLLRSAQNSNIAVVGGSFDRLEEILATASIPHTAHGSVSEALQDKPSVLFINCDRRHGKGTYHPAGVDSLLRKYVQEGGRFVTSDWAFSDFMAAFPGHAQYGPHNVSDSKCLVTPANDIGRRLLGAENMQTCPRWWFTSGNYTVMPVEQGKPIIPLILSEEFKAKHETDLVAFGIRHGKGEAVHFAGHHLYAQKVVSGAEGLATDYTNLHALLMLCGKAPVLWDPAAGYDTGGKSITMKLGTGKRSEDLA